MKTSNHQFFQSKLKHNTSIQPPHPAETTKDISPNQHAAPYLLPQRCAYRPTRHEWPQRGKPPEVSRATKAPSQVDLLTSKKHDETSRYLIYGSGRKPNRGPQVAGSNFSFRLFWYSVVLTHSHFFTKTGYEELNRLNMHENQKSLRLWGWVSLGLLFER